mmetsp:Transcript_32323/g.52218  ORF Transcript_32323/g.52218 Transcript_32323/m.52218 type:complete len:469 (+) Transcript_32323:73-1479(+)
MNSNLVNPSGWQGSQSRENPSHAQPLRDELADVRRASVPSVPSQEGRSSSVDIDDPGDVLKYLPAALTSGTSWIPPMFLKEEQSEEAKVLKRRARERESARRSRRRKKEMLETLEMKATRLADENTELRKQIAVTESAELEAAYQTLVGELARLIRSGAPEEAILECVRAVKSTFLRKTTAISQHLTDLQSIIPLLRQSDAILWLYAHMSLVTPTESDSSNDPPPVYMPSTLPPLTPNPSPNPSIQGQQPLFMPSSASERSTSTDGDSSGADEAAAGLKKRGRKIDGSVGASAGGGGPITVLSPPVPSTPRIPKIFPPADPVLVGCASPAEMGMRMCRHLLKAMRLNSAQAMQVHVFFADKREQICSVMNKQREMLEIVQRLGDLRKQHFRDWGELATDTDMVVGSISPGYRARMWLCAERYADVIMQMIINTAQREAAQQSNQQNQQSNLQSQQSNQQSIYMQRGMR